MEHTGRMDRETTNTKAMLTRRELEILRLLAAGQTSKQIAAALGLSPETVMWHRKQMHIKFGVHSSLEMVLSALEQKII